MTAAAATTTTSDRQRLNRVCVYVSGTFRSRVRPFVFRYADRSYITERANERSWRSVISLGDWECSGESLSGAGERDENMPDAPTAWLACPVALGFLKFLPA